MIFKRCTINGVDFGHNSISGKASSAGGGPRAVIPVNPALAEQLNSMDIQRLIERTENTVAGKEQKEQVCKFIGDPNLQSRCLKLISTLVIF